MRAAGDLGDDVRLLVEGGRQFGLELAFNHGIDLGRGRGIGR
jgi:hypothetical protein